jgi:hypothetical protein
MVVSNGDDSSTDSFVTHALKTPRFPIVTRLALVAGFGGGIDIGTRASISQKQAEWSPRSLPIASSPKNDLRISLVTHDHHLV